MKLSTRTTHGLVFLEILLVIALIIVGVLIVASAFDDVGQRARDAKRIAEIDAIQKALNLYYSGHAKFPVAPKETEITGDDAVSRTLEEELAIREVPKDPLYPAYAYTYQSVEDGSGYILKFCLETESIQNYKAG